MKANPVSTTLDFNIYDSREPQAVLEAARQTTLETISRNSHLMKIRSTIRTLIQSKNSESIDAKISERKYLLDMVSFWKSIATSVQTEEAENVFIGQVTALRSETRQSYRNTVRVTTLREDTISMLNQDVLAAKKRIEALDEELLQLNSRLTITISEADRQVLETLNLL